MPARRHPILSRRFVIGGYGDAGRQYTVPRRLFRHPFLPSRFFPFSLLSAYSAIVPLFRRGNRIDISDLLIRSSHNSVNKYRSSAKISRSLTVAKIDELSAAAIVKNNVKSTRLDIHIG